MAGDARSAGRPRAAGDRGVAGGRPAGPAALRRPRRPSTLESAAARCPPCGSPTRPGARSSPARRQRRPRAARPHRRQPRRRAGRARAPHRRAGGTALIGPGRPLDTDRWFVVAPNVLGGCQGTTGPASPGTRRPAVGQPVPRTHRPRPGRGRGARSPTGSASTAGRWCSAARWAACGRWSGPSTHPDAGGAAAACSPRTAAGDRRPDRLVRRAARRHPRRPGLPRRRLLRRRRPGQGPHVGLGVARRIAHATYRAGRGAQPAVRARRRSPARTRSTAGPVRGRVLPRPPRRQAGPPLRRQQLRRAHRGDEHPRRRPGPRRASPPRCAGSRPAPRSRPSTPTGSTRCS